MSLDPNLFSLEDIYPTGSGTIDTEGVRRDYDLRRRLTSEYQGLQVWSDMFAALSKALWENFEKHRRAIVEARDPAVIQQPFKPMHLRMLGLDYRSSILTDTDYDRISSFYSLYAKTTKHRDKFIHFMGFMKGLKIEMLRLWTTDYQSFNPGHGATVFASPEGSWYPTTHVGLAVETPDGVTRPTDAELTDLFYVLAPIHLVLKWIGDLMTIRLPDLKMDVVTHIDEEYVYTFVHIVYRLYWYMYVLGLDEEYWWGVFPDYYETADLRQRTALAETITEIMQVGANALNWVSSEAPSLPTNAYFNRDSRASYIDANRYVQWVDFDAPRMANHARATGALEGWLFEPERFGYIRNPMCLIADPWTASNVSYDAAAAIEAPDRSQVGLYTSASGATDPTTVYYEQSVSFIASDFTDWVVQVYTAGTTQQKLTIRWESTPGTEISTLTATWTGTTLSVTGASASGYTSSEAVIPAGWSRNVFGCTRPADAIRAVVRYYPCAALGDTARLWYVGMENGTRETTPLWGVDCDVCYRAPETLRFNDIAQTIMAGNQGFLALKATMATTDGVMLRLGSFSSQPYRNVQLVRTGTDTVATFNSDYPVDTNGSVLGPNTFTDTRALVSNVCRFGWIWDRTAQTLGLTHGGTQSNYTFVNPAVSAAAYLGSYPGQVSMWGTLQRITLMPAAITLATLDQLLT